MNNGLISIAALPDFEAHLRYEERSEATVSKYLHDVRAFFLFLADRRPEKQEVMEYKAHLLEHYAVKSANSMIAALNVFLRFLGRHDLCVRQFRVQREAYCSEDRELTREEYFRLVEAAKRAKNERLMLILQAICGTGIRVSELKYITVEALRTGEAMVSCKGKNRRIFIVSALRKKLLAYAKHKRLESGPVFLSGRGQPMDRSAIWREMKALCKSAGVEPAKVFPHNLRHLFARTFYGIEKDIAKLADILGHASINTTRVYIITTGAEHKRKMEHMHLIC